MNYAPYVCVQVKDADPKCVHLYKTKKFFIRDFDKERFPDTLCVLMSKAEMKRAKQRVL
jgi:hypothetical protein